VGFPLTNSHLPIFIFTHHAFIALLVLFVYLGARGGRGGGGGAAGEGCGGGGNFRIFFRPERKGPNNSTIFLRNLFLNRYIGFLLVVPASR